MSNPEICPKTEKQAFLFEQTAVEKDYNYDRETFAANVSIVDNFIQSSMCKELVL